MTKFRNGFIGVFLGVIAFAVIGAIVGAILGVSGFIVADVVGAVVWSAVVGGGIGAIAGGGLGSVGAEGTEEDTGIFSFIAIIAGAVIILGIALVHGVSNVFDGVFDTDPGFRSFAGFFVAICVGGSGYIMAGFLVGGIYLRMVRAMGG